jgi:hypothetical protein
MIQRSLSLLAASVFVCLTLYGAVSCYAQDTTQQKVVANFGKSYTITFGGVQKYVHDYLYSYYHPQHPADAYTQGLEDMLVNQLKRVDFFARGLDSNATMLQRMQRAINEELRDRYYRAQYYEKYVNEYTMQREYKELQRQVLFQLMALSKPDAPSRHDLDSLRALTRSLARRVREGESMARLERRFGTVPQQRDGDVLQTMTWKLSISDTLNRAIFTQRTPGVFVLESEQSFHIVRVVKIDTVAVQPYSLVKEEIRKALDERYGASSYDEYLEMKKGLLDEAKVTWKPKSVQQLLRWSNLPAFYQRSYGDTLRDAIAHGRNMVIMKYPGGQVDLKEYLRLLDDVLIPASFVTVREDDVKKFVVEAVRTDMVLRKAFKLRLQKDVFTATTTNPILKEGIVQLYNRYVIDAQIPPATDQALKDFYSQNRDSLYYQLAKVNLYAAVDTSRDAVIAMKERLAQNVPFEKIAPNVLVKTYVRNRDGSYRTFLGIEPPYLAEAGFRLNLNDVAGPVAFVDSTGRTHYALIKCVGRREEKQLTYDDVRGTIAEDFANYHRGIISRATRTALWKKYNVTLHPDVLRECLAAIGIKTN